MRKLTRTRTLATGLAIGAAALIAGEEVTGFVLPPRVYNTHDWKGGGHAAFAYQTGNIPTGITADPQGAFPNQIAGIEPLDDPVGTGLL